MNGLAAFLSRSLRGARLVQFGALLVLLVMVLGVYLAKAHAGRQRAEIASVQAQIDEEQKRMRLLQAEVAHLEEPARLERLSVLLGLGPINAKHEGAPEQLGEIARAALIPEKGAKAAPSASTQSGFEAPAAPAPGTAPTVQLAQAAKPGAPR